MKKTSKTIVFFGTDEFSLTTLRGLYEAGYIISAVVTKPDSRSGRGQKINYNPVKKFALDKDIAVLQPQKVSEINEQIKALGQDIIGVLVVFGKIIPKSTIDLFPLGIINIHPSLLPKYRGPSPIESAILNDDKNTGISIMQIDVGMDSGPIYSQINYSLDGSESRPELYNTFAKLGTEMLIKILPRIIDGTLTKIPQNNDLATYCNLISKTDGILDPSRTTADYAERMVRAYLTYPKTRLDIQSHNIIVTKAHAATKAESKNTLLDIECCDGNFIIVDELIAPSGKTMKSSAFINGYL